MPTDPTFECINIPKRIYRGISDIRNLGLLWGQILSKWSFGQDFQPFQRAFWPFGPTRTCHENEHDHGELYHGDLGHDNLNYGHLHHHGVVDLGVGETASFKNKYFLNEYSGFTKNEFFA